MKSKLFLLLSLIVISNSFAGGPKHLSNGEKWVPKDFDPKNTVLLIARFPSPVGKNGLSKFYNQEEKIVKNLKIFYPYPYEIIDDTSDPKYSDKEKYPYVLHIVKTVSTVTYSAAPSSTTVYACKVYSRKEGKFIEIPDAATGSPSSVVNLTVNTMLYIYEQRSKQK